MKTNIIYPLVVTILITYYIKIDKIMDDLTRIYNDYPTFCMSIIWGVIAGLIFIFVQWVIYINKAISKIDVLAEHLYEFNKYTIVTFNQFKRSNDNQFDVLYDNLEESLKKINPNITFDKKIHDLYNNNEALVKSKNDVFYKSEKTFLIVFKDILK